MTTARGAFYMHMEFSIPAEKLEEFKASALILATETAKEEGSINFFFSRKGEPDANTFALFEEWASEEALAAHKEQPHFKEEFTDKVAKYWVFKNGSFVNFKSK
jgi:quinol monooxygenase YgiN